METGKPLICILLAVYEPRMDWLREQLDSLNAQTWPNLRLYVRDDCSPGVPFAEIQRLIAERVTAFPCELARNERNLGSNGTFERLTREAEGEYFAYCDQDDVWLPEKLETLYGLMLRRGVTLAYSDLSVIDEESRVTAQSLRALRPRLRYVQGEHLAETYFFRNCTAGCSMLIRSETAKRALPFPQETVCDQWLAIVAAGLGAVAMEERPLVKYRQHENNQTGVLRGVTNRESYRAKRLAPLRERFAFYQNYFSPSPAMAAFVEARLEGRAAEIWKYRAFSPWEAYMEIVMKLAPEPLFRFVLRKIR